ncbi:MAG: DoxX family protein, partial [Verrucomicrobia bacterium]
MSRMDTPECVGLCRKTSPLEGVRLPPSIKQRPRRADWVALPRRLDARWCRPTHSPPHFGPRVFRFASAHASLFSCAMWRWSFFDRWHDFGLLVLRAGVGAVFLFIHGFPKLADSDSWARVGRAVSYLGIGFAHQTWGFAAILAMTAGAACLILGFLHRLAALILTITM